MKIGSKDSSAYAREMPETLMTPTTIKDIQISTLFIVF